MTAPLLPRHEELYGTALGLIAAALDPEPGQAFRTMVTDLAELRDLVELVWVQALITSMLLEAWAAPHEGVTASALLQDLAARSIGPAQPPSC